MTEWFRTWHGAPSDPKWRLIAKRAAVRAGDVWAVVSYLFDRASQAEDRGSIVGADPELIAEVFGYEAEDVSRIIAELEVKAVIVAGRLAAWDKYQPKREDNSAERTKQWRERNKPQANAQERDVTQRDAPEQSRADTEQKIEPLAQRPTTAARENFEELERKLFEAAGIAGFRAERHPKLMDLSPILALIERGYDLDADILPIIRARSRNKTFSTWAFFTDAIVEAAASKRAIPQLERPPPVANWPPEKWRPLLAHWRETGNWNRDALGPAPDEPGCKAPKELTRNAA